MIFLFFTNASRFSWHILFVIIYSHTLKKKKMDERQQMRFIKLKPFHTHTPAAYTESVYGRWFKQLQRADAVLKRSPTAFMQMTMPEIKVAELPEPEYFKDRHDRLDFLPKHIMEFMLDPNNATHWLKYSSPLMGIGGRTIHVHIVHYQRHVSELIKDEVESINSMNAMNEDETQGVDRRWLKRYRAYVYKIFAWFHLIAPYIRNRDCECSKELSVYLYMTPFKKEFPARSSSVLGPTHSNTGFTTSCTANLSKNGGKNHTEIVIYRHEEFFKVLLHETMHNLDLDFGHGTADVSVDKVFPGIRHPIILSETYVETWARLLNVAFYCYYDIYGSSGSYGSYQTAVRRCLNAERAFSLYQAQRVLNHMGLSLQQLLSTYSDSKSLVSKLYDEDTNVFAYYILTGLILFEADLFVQWCKDTNHASLICANSGRSGTAALLIFIEMILKENTDLEQAIEAVSISIDTAATTARMTLWQ